MSLTTGLDAQVGLAEEVTFGDFVVPSLFLMFNSEGLAGSQERIESEAIRPGGLVLHEDDWENGREGAEGPLEFEWPDRGTRLLGKHMLGKVTTTEVVVGEVYRHVCEFAPLDGKSLCAQVGRPDNSGTVQPWSYVGLKIAEWEISNEVDGYLLASLTFDGQREFRPDDVGAPVLAAANFVAGQRKLAWTGGVVRCDGAEVPVTDVSFGSGNSIRSDRFFIRTDAGLKDEQLDGDGRREPEGSFSGEYGPALAAVYAKFKSGAPAAVEAEWKGREIGTSGEFYGLKVSAPSVRIDGETPTVGGAESIPMEIPFTVTWDGTASPISFEITDDQPGV